MKDVREPVILNILIRTCLIALALICGMEGLVSVVGVGVSHLPSLLPWPPAYDVYLAQPRYQNPDGIAYWREFRQSAQIEYADGLMWRRRDMHGSFINVVDGERVVPDPSRVGVFGGSAVWGTGVADAETIPAFLGAHNYGEGGYNSTQVFLRLSQTLAVGPPIDLAIIYDGLNDVQAGCVDPGIPGATLLYRDLKARFDYDRFGHLRIEDLFIRILGRFRPAFHASTCDADAVAHRLEQTWLQMQAVADVAGVQTFFVLQPVRSDDPVYAQVYRQIHPSVRHFLDLSRLELRDLPASDWIDFAHLTADGNRRVADWIADALKGL